MSSSTGSSEIRFFARSKYSKVSLVIIFDDSSKMPASPSLSMQLSLRSKNSKLERTEGHSFDRRRAPIEFARKFKCFSEFENGAYVKIALADADDILLHDRFK